MMHGFFYFLLVVTVVFVLVFVGYYSWRLMRLRAPRDDSNARLRALLSVDSVDGGVPTSRAVAASTAGPRDGAAPPAGSTPPFTQVDAVAGSARVHERYVGLRAISADPVFMSRSKSGEVTVQLDSRPSMPLTYLLDPRARHALQQVSSLAVLDWGDSWSVLASEDEQGRLVLTRLV